MEGKQVLEVEVIGLHAGSGQLLNGFVEDALGAPPTDQSHVRLRRSFELWRRELFERERQFLHPLLGTLAADGGVGELVGDENALLVVLVGPGNVQSVGGAGQRPRRDARRGEGVALEAAIAFGPVGDHLAAVDGDIGRHGIGFDGLRVLAHEQVRNQDDRKLVSLRQVEGLDGRVEAVGGVGGRNDDAGEVALRSAVHLVQVSLLGFGRDAS